MVRLLTIVLFPLLVLLTIVAPVLVPFLFGPRWSAAIVPVQILAVGGAATLVIDAVGTVLMATGRTRALLGYGIGHFLTYALAVLLVVSHGIVAVAIVAGAVHTLFLGVAYALMLRGSSEPPLRRLWEDIAPATVSCLGLVVIALPANLALSAAHIPAILQLTIVCLVALPPYLLTLRICFPAASRSLRATVEQCCRAPSVAVGKAVPGCGVSAAGRPSKETGCRSEHRSSAGARRGASSGIREGLASGERRSRTGKPHSYGGSAGPNNALSARPLVYFSPHSSASAAAFSESA